MTDTAQQRPVNAEAVRCPDGYRVEALIVGLTFPTAISFGPGGEIYLAEGGGLSGDPVSIPRVLRVDPDRSVSEIGRLEAPIVGLVYRHGELLIGTSGADPLVLRVTAEGEVRKLVDGLPGGGDYGLSGLSLDHTGALLFGIGTRTNSGVVGLDNVARGWVARRPELHDLPGVDVRLTGTNYVTPGQGEAGDPPVVTGGLRPFGRRCVAGEVLAGNAMSCGSVLRLRLDGAVIERVAWGLRNPVGIAVGPEARIFVTEGGMEERGSRPVTGAADNLWQIEQDGYYGWPDHAGGISLTDPCFRLPGHPQPRPLMEGAPAVSGTPVASFPAGSGVGRLDFARSERFGYRGDALVALSGPWCPPAYAGPNGPAHGHRVARVDPRGGHVVDFLVNRSGRRSSADGSGGLERPFDIRFDPTGDVLYVVDLGEVRLRRDGCSVIVGGTGVVWRVTRVRPLVSLPRSRPAAGVEDAADEDEIDGEETPGIEEVAIAGILEVPDLDERAEDLPEEVEPDVVDDDGERDAASSDEQDVEDSDDAVTPEQEG